MVVDLGDGTYAVRFYRDGQPQYVRVDGELWTDPYGTPRYARPGGEGAIWVPIVEKAWAFFRHQEGNYDSIRYGEETDAGLLGVTRVVLPKQAIPTDRQVYDWYNAGSPAGTLANQIRGGAEAWLYEIKAQLAAGNTVRVGAVPGISNTTPIRFDDPATADDDDYTYRRGTHVFTVDSVLTDASGNVTGIKLRNPYGYDHTITDMTRIYFCLTAGDAWSA
jgi:hypothetical protein